MESSNEMTLRLPAGQPDCAVPTFRSTLNHSTLNFILSTFARLAAEEHLPIFNVESVFDKGGSWDGAGSLRRTH